MGAVFSKAERFTLASQIYVRLRRCNGRVIDAIYMVENEPYAREILAMASQQTDVELLSLLGRYEEQLEIYGSTISTSVASIKAKTPEAVSASILLKEESVPLLTAEDKVIPPDKGTPDAVPITEPTPQQYIGALR
jgi:hypothetical protein